jgi:enoyl-CoA hydratase/carnithine racemase
MTEATGSVLLWEQIDNIVVLTMNRPDRRNALNNELLAELTSALDRIEADPSIRATVVTGAGAAFCSGMDLKEFRSGERRRGDRPTIFRYVRTKPLIAAVNGPAVAGGFEIVLACDLSIVAEGARLGLAEVQRGLVPGGGGTFRLARRAGVGVATQMLLTGELIDADEAVRLGIASKAVAPEELMEVATTLAKRVAGAGPLAVAAVLDLMRRVYSPEEEALWEMTSAQTSRVNSSADAKEGAQAFLEKRTPVWRGE